MSTAEVMAATLPELAAAEAVSTRCPLYRFATQVVPGEGRPDAQLMLVGEQPGDSEDKAGRPFVGPAGRMLDQALRGRLQALADGTALFVTVHPSYLLRIREGDTRAREYGAFVADVRRSWRHVAAR